MSREDLIFFEAIIFWFKICSVDVDHQQGTEANEKIDSDILGQRPLKHGYAFCAV